MILVTGATGVFGKNAIAQLIQKGVQPSNISALIRNPEKADFFEEKGIQVKIGDYTDYDSLVLAFKGVDKLLFVSSSTIEDRDAQHLHVVNAAKAVGIHHIVYTSFIRNTEIENSAISFLQDSHLKTENWIKETGINYTFLQNALYMDLLPMFIGEKVSESGRIMLPAKLGKSNAVLREELAEAAAIVLTSKGHENKVYPLVNNKGVDYTEIASYISEISGTTIKYISPSPEEYQETLKKHGVPSEYIQLFTAFSIAQANGELKLTNNTLEKLLGRKPTTPKAFLEKIYG